MRVGNEAGERRAPRARSHSGPHRQDVRSATAFALSFDSDGPAEAEQAVRLDIFPGFRAFCCNPLDLSSGGLAAGIASATWGADCGTKMSGIGSAGNGRADCFPGRGLGPAPALFEPLLKFIAPEADACRADPDRGREGGIVFGDLVDLRSRDAQIRGDLGRFSIFTSGGAMACIRGESPCSGRRTMQRPAGFLLKGRGVAILSRPAADVN